MKSFLVFAMFLFISSTHADLNKLTGQPQFTIALGPHATLLYKGGVAGDTCRPNEQSPAGVAGLGWEFGTPYITVDHKYTVDISDDNWYMCDGYGSSDEIIRVVENSNGGTTEKFYLQKSPERTVKVIANSPLQGQMRIIRGWEIYSTSGTISRYGYVAGEPDDAMRYIPSWGNYIGKGDSGSVPVNYYYQWDLKAIDDVHNQRTRFNYWREPRFTVTGYPYIGQSNITSIVTPIGELTQFEYSEIDMNGNEYRNEAVSSDFNFFSLSFLRKITIKNRAGTIIADANLSYSDTTGSVKHVRYNQQGFAKRLLTSITSSTKKEYNYWFTYSSLYPGLLTKVKNINGGETEYTYELVKDTLLESFNTGIKKQNLGKCGLSQSGNHVLLKYTDGASLKIQLYDKTKIQWQRSDIAGITDTLFSNAKVELLGDFLVVNVATAANHRELNIYKWFDDRWVYITGESEGTSGTIQLDQNFVYGGNYLISHENSVANTQVINIISKGVSQETFTTDRRDFPYNFPYSEGAEIKATKDYFVYSYHQAGNRYVRVFRFNGTSWDNGQIITMFEEDVYDINATLQVFDNYFIVQRRQEDYRIMRWDAASQTWKRETIPAESGETLKEPMWGGNDFVFTERDDENDPEYKGLCVYRYMANSNGRLEWKRTTIKQGNCGYLSVRSGTILSGEDMFTVVKSQKDACVIYSLRWFGNQQAGEWKTVLRDTMLDGNCYAIILWYSSKVCTNVFPGKETFGLTYRGDNVWDPIQNVIYYYDYTAQCYKRTSGVNNYGVAQGDDKIFTMSDMATFQIAPETSQDDTLNMIISQRYQKDLLSGQFPRVKEVVKRGGEGSNITTTIDYEDTNSTHAIEPYNGVLFHSLVSEIQSGMTNTKTTTEYCIDSSKGLFGQVYATTMHKTNVTPYNDDTVRVSGWMMESDGYTPALGWVRLSETARTRSSPLCQIDPKTGWFSVKYYNPTNTWIGFDRLYTNNPSAAYQMVFWISTPDSIRPAKIWFVPPGSDVARSTPVQGDYKNFTNIKINHTMVDAMQNNSGSLEWEFARRPDPLFSSVNFYGVNEQTRNYRKLMQLRPVRTVTTKDGVRTAVETPFHWYDSLNNLPMLSYTVKGDTALVQQTSYAYQQYGYGMMGPDIANGQKHMLSQVATSTTYGVRAPELLMDKRESFALNPTPSVQTEFFSSQLNRIHSHDKIVISLSMSTIRDVVEDSVVFYLLVNGLAVDKFTRYRIYQHMCEFKAMVSYVVPENITVNSIRLRADGIDNQMDFCDLTATVHCNPWPDNNGAINAAAVTWNNNLKLSGTQAWQPSATYKWNVPLNNSTPVSGLTPFNFNNLQSNKLNGWKIADSNTLYTSYGAMQEKVTQQNGSKKLYTVSVKRNDIRIPSASITNAKFRESGAFTCDYDLDETDTRGGRYFDLENGWAKGFGTSVEITPDAKHFGEKGLKATNSFGAVRAFKLERNRNYILSAWVKPIITSGTTPSSVPLQKGVVMNVTYRRSPDNGGSWPLQVYLNEGSTPEIQSSGTVEVTRYGDWCYCELEVPASTDLQSAWSNGYEFATAWVGCPIGNNAGQSGTVYIDDIRFYPEDAFVTTTYYDQKWYQPILSVDANNNPGQKVLYDEFGRTKEVRKVTSANPDYGTTITTTEYHLAGEPDVSWTKASGTIAAQANTGYMTTGAEPVDFTLPATCAVGDRIKIRGNGSGGWRIAQGDGQSISGEGLTKKSYGGWREILSSLVASCGIASTKDGSQIWVGANTDLTSAAKILHSNDGGVSWRELRSVESCMSIDVSSDGKHIFIASQSNQLFNDYISFSHDYGNTWGVYENSKNWMSVACSEDGSKVVAVDYGKGSVPGNLYVSTNGGLTWSVKGYPSKWWSVDCSEDGMTMVAGGDIVYLSGDGGTTWIEKQHTNGIFTSVKCSPNGKLITAFDNVGNLYSSYNSGETWKNERVRRNDTAYVSSYCHDKSIDGQTIVVQDYVHKIYSSFDGGKTWCTYPETDNHYWLGITISDDGSKIIALDHNGIVFGADLILTPITSTTTGPTGSLSGKQGSSIDLEYLGSGQFRMNSFTGELDAR